MRKTKTLLMICLASLTLPLSACGSNRRDVGEVVRAPVAKTQVPTTLLNLPAEAMTDWQQDLMNILNDAPPAPTSSPASPASATPSP